MSDENEKLRRENMYLQAELARLQQMYVDVVVFLQRQVSIPLCCKTRSYYPCFASVFLRDSLCSCVDKACMHLWFRHFFFVSDWEQHDC